jgi:hypothetical protein
MDLTSLLKCGSTTLLAAVFAYRHAVASSLPDPRFSIQSVTEASDDLYGVAAVSSFYGPGAWLGIRDCAARVAIEYFASGKNHAKTVCTSLSPTTKLSGFQA